MVKKFTRTILRGVGQVMFQNNAITGLLFLIGIFYNSWIMGIGAVLGNVVSTFTAYLFKYSKEEIENGLYGFNGTLVGIAIFFYFGFNITATIFVIFGSIISTVIMHEVKKKIPALTAPFVISTWIVIFIVWLLNAIPLLSLSFANSNSLNLLQSVTTGFGQVMFQNSIITGFLFIIGILINSKRTVLYAVYGAALSIFIASALLLNISLINIGIFSYNAILCSIALGNNQKKDYLFITIAIILSVIFTYLFGKSGVIALTAPFVLATWIVLAVKYFINRKITISQTP